MIDHPYIYPCVRVDHLNWTVKTEDQKTSENQGKLNVTFYFSKISATKDFLNAVFYFLFFECASGGSWYRSWRTGLFSFSTVTIIIAILLLLSLDPE